MKAERAAKEISKEILIFFCLAAGHREHEVRLFLEVQSKGRCNGHKLGDEKLQFDIRKKKIIARVVK